MNTEQDAQQEKGKNGYLAVKPTPETANLIAHRLEELGIYDAIPAEKLHVTLYYAPAGLPDSVKATVDATATHLGLANGEPHILGDAPWKALVIPLDAPTLHQRHDFIRDSTGVPYSHPEYVPHMSLKYNPTPEDLAKAQADPLLNKIAIDLTGEYCDDLTS